MVDDPDVDFDGKGNPFASPVEESHRLDFSRSPRLRLKQILFSTAGRIPRRVYWAATIGATGFLYSMVLTAVFVAGALFNDAESIESAVTILAIVLYPPLIWITVAVQAKRWHDRGKSGWMFCINFIPIIGPIWTFVECGCLRGTFGPNQYGNDPT